MRQCAECGKPISRKAKQCVYCGRPCEPLGSFVFDCVAGILIVLLVCLLLYMIFVWLSFFNRSDTPSDPEILRDLQRQIDREKEAGPRYRNLQYIVRGSAERAVVTYIGEKGDERKADVRLPWRYAARFRTGKSAYISATNKEVPSTIIVEIEIDGSTWKTAQSSGTFAVAGTSGSVPHK